MAEIIKTYRQKTKAARFIGKRYTDADRADGNFGSKWNEWFRNGRFNEIEKLIGADLDEINPDGGAYVGLMRDKGGDHNDFEYWIGMFAPEGTPVPAGFEFTDFPEGWLGVCWVYGKEGEVYMKEGECGSALVKEGFIISGEWCFERYACPRFTTPDEKENIILDICFFIE